MDKNQSAFVAELAKLRASSTFLSVNGYRNAHSELANYSIIFHMSYQNALKKSQEIVSAYVPVGDYEVTAKKEILRSIATSLEKLETTPQEELEDHYIHFIDDDGQYIKGVKYHLTSETLHLYGLVVHKKILLPGDYPADKRRPLTLAKDKIKSLCPISKFRQFRITQDQVDSIKVQNMSLLPP